MVIRTILLAAVVLAFAFPMPAQATSCGRQIVLINHRSEPVVLTLKWFYGERPGKPDRDDFAEVDVQRFLIDGFARLEEIEVAAGSTESLFVRSICGRGAVSKDYLNWRYALPGTGRLSGQIDASVDALDVHVR